METDLRGGGMRGGGGEREKVQPLTSHGCPLLPPGSCRKEGKEKETEETENRKKKVKSASYC